MLKSFANLAHLGSRDWSQLKQFIAHATGVSHDAMHVVLGVVLQLLVARVFRSSIGRAWPWLLVLIAELTNEASDLFTEVWPSHAMQWGEGAKDLILTMILPTILLLIARRKPSLLGSGRT